MHRLVVPHWPPRMPAHVVNGITVALGFGLLQWVFTAVAGAHLAQLALSGAIYASLADLSGTLGRAWRRLLAAAAAGCASAFLGAARRVVWCAQARNCQVRRFANRDCTSG